MSKQKGGRSTNMTLADKDLLIDLALKHRSIISNKKTDAFGTPEGGGLASVG